MENFLLAVQEQDSFEIEKQFTRVSCSDLVWKYDLQLENIGALINITVLFRGQDEDILSHFLYGVLTVNGVVVDILRTTSTEDPRVKEFCAFTLDSPFPAFAKCNAAILIVFKKSHQFSTDKLRVIADGFALEQIPNISEYKAHTTLAQLNVREGSLECRGITWTLDFADAIIDDQVEQEIASSPPTEDVHLVEDCVKELSFYEKLDDLVAWRAQRIRLKLTLLSMEV